jgi:AcrR family transcriptional regulator
MPKVSEAYLAEKRQMLLDAAIACFARNGFHKTTMEDIGREAGVSATVAYRYFDSKEDIIVATVEHSVDRLARRLNALQDDDYIPALFEQMIRDFYHRIDEPERAAHYRVRMLLWAETLQNPKVAAEAQIQRHEAQNRLVRLVENGQERGQIRSDLDASVVAGAYMASLDGFVLHWLADPDVDIPTYRDAHLAMIGGLFKQCE